MSLKFAVDEALYGLQQVALLFDCAPEKTNDDTLSSPVPAASRSPMSSVVRDDAAWTTAISTIQVGC